MAANRSHILLYDIVLAQRQENVPGVFSEQVTCSG